MPASLDPTTSRALRERLRYYQELGIYDFYRRPGSAFDSENTIPAEPQEVVSPVPVPAASPNVIQERNHSLRVIREDIGDCTRCRLHAGRTNLVFGVGNSAASLMFVGEGPGADEDARGEPFVGRAGQLLNKMIEAMGLKREDVYIANIVKCRPPNNRTPERDECETCLPFLQRQIETIQPRVIVALGAVAARNLLNLNEPMSSLRGRWFDYMPPRTLYSGSDYQGSRLAVTYHPAYLLRDPRQKKEAWKDLQMVMEELGLKQRRATKLK